MRNVIIYFLMVFMALPCSIIGASRKSGQSKQKTVQTINLPKDTILYKRAVKGDADAQAFIGQLYYLGIGGVEENDKEALRWIRKSHNGKSPYGKYWLGLLYSNGIGSKNTDLGVKICDEGIAEIRALAEKGDSIAQYYLGEAYEDGNVGDDGEPDYKNALIWYEKAVETGYLDAYCKAAQCLKNLYGSNNKRAFELIKEASEKGNPLAQYEFSSYYFQGLGVPQSYEEEFKLLMKSAEGGCEEGYFSIGEHYELGFGVDRNIQEAIKWYRKSGADYRLGCFYRDGVGVDRNYDRAIMHFNKAIKKGFKNATSAIRQMQRKGRVYYAKLPKRNPDDYYLMKEEDPFTRMSLSTNWNELNDYMKATYLMAFKDEKFLEWGEEKATKVAHHLVEIGFNQEQVYYSQGWNYKKKFIDTPSGEIELMIYDHCTYFLLRDKVIAMLWNNGMQIGDRKVIRTYSGNYVITTGNR